MLGVGLLILARVVKLGRALKRQLESRFCKVALVKKSKSFRIRKSSSSRVFCEIVFEIEIINNSIFFLIS